MSPPFCRFAGRGHASSPVFFARPRVGLSSSFPSKLRRGTARRWAQPVLQYAHRCRCAAPCGAPWRRFLRQRAALSSGYSRPDRQPAPGGGSVSAPGRSPAAARVRKERPLPPAGAASRASFKTPHESAPHARGTYWAYKPIGMLSRGRSPNPCPPAPKNKKPRRLSGGVFTKTRDGVPFRSPS